MANCTNLNDLMHLEWITRDHWKLVDFLKNPMKYFSEMDMPMIKNCQMEKAEMRYFSMQ